MPEILVAVMEKTNFGAFCLLLLFTLGGATQHDVESTVTCPCLNGGTFTGDACVCPTGYDGLYCETEVADPEPYVPCDSSCNNGYCDYTSGTCVCHPFYGGDYCNITLTRPCGDYYCFNAGTCETNTSSGVEYCQCTEGYSGEYCHYADDICFCLNGGTCDTSGGTASCSCPAGFTGEYCQIEICTPECPFNAYCCNGTCQCYPGYTGENCTEVEDSVSGLERCGDYFCFNGGTCENDQCLCAEGFGGDYCLYSAVEICGDYYCFNGGTCQNDTCLCAEGFGGDYCQYNTDCTGSSDGEDLQTCGNHVCFYGGTCANDTCQCPPFTFGVYCEYVQVPTNRPVLEVTTDATSATLQWNVPFQYEAISSAGGVKYTVVVENMATGRKDTITASDNSITPPLVESTQYCFTVRAEVSGGAGQYSDRMCITTPGHGSCFCANDGMYDAQAAECNCQDSYRGDYCEVPIIETGACPAESKYNSELGHAFEWSKTAAGQSILLSCPCNSTLDLTSEIYATRSCSNEGIWLTADNTGCSATAVKDLCEVSSTGELLNRVSAPRTEPLQAGGVAVTLKAVEVLATDETQTWPTDTLLDSVDATLSTPDGVLAMTQQNSNAATVLVRTLEEISRDALDASGPGSSWMQERTNFAVSGMAVDGGNVPEEGFHISFGSGFDGSVKAVLLKHLFNDMLCNSSVFVSSVISKTALFGGTVEGDEDKNSRLVSHIFSVAIGNCTINGSMEAIEITFKVPQSAHYSTLDCYYWKTSANSGLGAWSRNGCSKKGQQTGEIICSCNHLASFAVLQTFPIGSIEVTVLPIAVASAAILVVILLIVLIGVVMCCCCHRRKRCCAKSGTDEVEPSRRNGDHEWPSEQEAMCKINPVYIDAIDVDMDTNLYEVMPTKPGAEIEDTIALVDNMEMPGVVIVNPLCEADIGDEDKEN